MPVLFGYTHSDLREYIEEKSGSAYRVADVQSVSLDDLRSLDLDGIAQKLNQLNGFQKLIVNAADDYDVKVFCIALYRALAKGKLFCCRTAASFVKAVADIGDQPLLQYTDMISAETNHGSIIMVVSAHKENNRSACTALNASAGGSCGTAFGFGSSSGRLTSGDAEGHPSM